MTKNKSAKPVQKCSKSLGDHRDKLDFLGNFSSFLRDGSSNPHPWTPVKRWPKIGQKESVR